MRYAHLVQMHREQAERLGPGIALRYRKYGRYADVTWRQYRADVLACAVALMQVGVQSGDRVGLFAENRMEWLVADLAILTAGAVCVTPHAPLTARQVQYELADAEASWLFVSGQAQLDKILSIREELPLLRGIVTFDSLSLSETPDLHSWRSFLQRGRQTLPEWQEEAERREAALGPDSLATIMYTSGTTGHPKGVMLTHGNLVSNAEAVLAATPPRPDDVLLSWLPYSHIYARTVDHYRGIASGAVLSLATGPETLLVDLAEIQPTHMNSVPRFYEKVYTHVAHADPAVVRRRLRDIFGPRVEYLSSGGAPLPPAIAQAYRDAGLLLLQGYGLTESSPVISFNAPQAYKLGSVGRPLPGVEVSIGADGEVLTRGPHVMKGYWKNPQATVEAISDGWLHTGDIGQLDEDGFLSITGRKKELLVLSNGKKVVPSYLEGKLLADPCVDQVVVCGEGKNFLTALLVPNWKTVRAELEARGTPVAGDEQTLARAAVVRDLLQQHIHQALAEVAGWEQIRKFVVLPQPFSVARDEMTVSLKLRRTVILQHYADRLEELYQSDRVSGSAE